jgi:alanine racemase
MSVSSRVVYFKVVRAGAGVSYGATWRAPHDSRVVTVPIGYGDGYPRALSNRASVLIRGKRYPVVGNVCMDQIMVNIDHDEAYNGDEVVIIGTQGDATIGVSELARVIGTVPHEILTALNLRIPRRYRRNGAILPAE